MTIWPSNNTMPSIYSWYVGIQHQLPARFALDVSYSGSHSVHLMDQRQVNAQPAGFLQNNNLSASVNGWTSEQYTSALRHDQSNPGFNPDVRQVLHVGYKVAAKMGDKYLKMLDACEVSIARNVTENLFDRHIAPLFLEA